MNTVLFTFEMIHAVAVMNPEGFTIDAKTFAPITKGYAVAVKDTQNSFADKHLAIFFQQMAPIGIKL